MTLEEMTAKLGKANAFVPGKVVKLDFGTDGALRLDGIAQTVSNEDGPADTTISISWADWEALSEGNLDPMAAFMQGKLKVQGDMGLAMQLQSLLTKLKG